MAQANARGLGLLGVEWPEGEPDGLAEGATRIAGEAESLDGLARSVVDVALSSGAWSGLAAYAMRQEAQARAGVVRMAATPLLTVSSVLLQYARILDDVQSQLVEMADRAVELEREIDAAHETARVARAAAAGASQRAQQAAANDDPTTAGACRLAASAELSAAQVADGAAEQAQEELERLRRRAARLVARERRTSRQAAALIEAAEVPIYEASMLPAALSAGGEVMRVAIETAKQRAAHDGKKGTGLLHGLLDAIGTVDPTPLTDGINAGIYLAEGDRTGAALSAAGMLPYIGDAAKIGGRVAKNADNIAALGKNVPRHDMTSAYYKGPVDEDGIAIVNGRRVGNHKYAGGYHPKTGVPYSREGFPIFGDEIVARAVKVPNLTGRYRPDESLANQQAGLRKTPPGFVWHHVEDGTTMQLVPKDLHSTTRHTGGAAVIRENLRAGP